jgi:Tfp pilus assembly protein PilP
MKLANNSAKLLVGLALSFCLVSATGAQTAPAPASTTKTATKKTHKKPAAPAAAPAADASAAKPVIAESGKRDPFQPLVNDRKTGGPPLPPGKAGLQVATVHVDGTVSSPGGMLAVVSNPDQRVYFLREGDKLYDGDVEKIGLDGVTFKENSKDAFGKQVERTVTKRIYPSAGEQQ